MKRPEKPGDRELCAGDDMMMNGSIRFGPRLSPYVARWQSRNTAVQFFWKCVHLASGQRHLGTTGMSTGDRGRILDLLGYPMLEELDRAS
jgi:hypothetical protein